MGQWRDQHDSMDYSVGQLRESKMQIAKMRMLGYRSGGVFPAGSLRVAEH